MKFVKFVQCVTLLSLSVWPCAQGAFVQVTDLQSAILGQSVSTLGWGGTANALPYTTIVQDPANTLNQVIRTATSTGSNGVYLNLGANAIGAGETGTIFFRVRFESDFNYNVNFGVGNATDGDRALQAQIRTRGTTPNQWDVYSAGTDPLVATTPALRATDTWYDIWIVVNPDGQANKWEAYFREEGGELFSFTTGVSNTLFGFKQNTGLDKATDRFAIHFGSVSGVGTGNAEPVYFSDIFVDSTGRNLLTPIPEPGTWTLLSGSVLAGLAVMRRRG